MRVMIFIQYENVTWGGKVILHPKNAAQIIKDDLVAELEMGEVGNTWQISMVEMEERDWETLQNLADGE